MRLYCAVLFILCAGIASAQFAGGNNDGYDCTTNLSTTSIYLGGLNDGFVSNEFTNLVSIYFGGHKDGYNREKLNSNLSIYTGSTEDGYAASSFNNTLSIYVGGHNDGYNQEKLNSNLSIYTGSTEDGYAASSFNNTLSIYAGGNQDGYATASFSEDSFKPFITTWQTTNPYESITIPTFLGETYDYTVDWGDDTVDINQGGDATHIYPEAGIYTVAIRGDFPRIYFNNTGDKNKILSIEQWGDVAWASMAQGFYGCVNLVENAADAPDLSGVTSMVGMFWSSSLNQDIGNWDVSNVEDMSDVFINSQFNQDISNWDVSNVTNMRSMFNGTSSFNQDLSNWDVSNVTNMEFMFDGVTLSTQNYDAILDSWSQQALQSGVTFNGGNSQYCSSAEARQSIIDSFGWNITDGGLEVENTFYADIDTDGYGDPENTIIACIVPTGYISNDLDCDDGDININPDTTDVCDGIDNDCDGELDEDGDTVFYADVDSDGFGDNNNTILACTAPSGYVSDNTDCNDSNSEVNPNATEIPDNGLDDDCNPSTSDCVADSDRDGTPNCFDACPNDRNKIAPGECGCGVRDNDKDRDGIANCNDVCPKADDTSDVDQDGIPDCIDPCPNDATNSCSINPCNPGQILICHIKKNGTRQDLCVSSAQYDKHIAHGDFDGSCSAAFARSVPYNSIKLFPNPASNSIAIVAKNSHKLKSVIFVDVLGQKVLGISKDFKQINIESLSNGMYFLKIKTESIEVIKKLIIDRN